MRLVWNSFLSPPSSDRAKEPFQPLFFCFNRRAYGTAVVIFDVGSRVRNVATETAGVPNDSSLVIAVVSTVDAVMPPSLPTESNFKDQDGAEGWILPKLD